jgi:hypothetical protein
MLCPHCKKTLLYRERGGRQCSACKCEFAFEPKTGPLRLHDLRFRKTVAKVGDNGRLRYTADQLRHFLARKVVAAQKPTSLGVLVTGTLLAAFLAGTAVSAVVSPRLGIPLALLVLIAGAAFGWRQSRRPFHPRMPIDAAKFATDVLGRWQKVYGGAPDGLINEASLRDPARAALATEGLRAVVVCPERGVLACLLANRIPEKLRVGLLPTEPPFDAWEEAILAVLRKEPRLPILLLHDASAAGALLAQDLPLLLRLSPEHRIVDLGLNPRRSIEKQRLRLGAPVPQQALDRLRAQALDGAPPTGPAHNARPLRRRRAVLTPLELAWLEQGHYSPVLALAPADIVKRVTAGLERVAARRGAERPAESSEPIPARAVTFLSWPE